MEEANASDVRRRGPAGYVDGDITQEVAQCWVPAGSRIHLDRFNGRWRVSWQFGDVSRSFALYGFKLALIHVFRTACTLV